MNKVIDKGFRSWRFVSTIVKHPVQVNISYCIAQKKTDVLNEELCKYKLVYIIYFRLKIFWYETTSVCEIYM